MYCMLGVSILEMIFEDGKMLQYIPRVYGIVVKLEWATTSGRIAFDLEPTFFTKNGCIVWVCGWLQSISTATVPVAQSVYRNFPQDTHLIPHHIKFHCIIRHNHYPSRAARPVHDLLNSALNCSQRNISATVDIIRHHPAINHQNPFAAPQRPFHVYGTFECLLYGW